MVQGLAAGQSKLDSWSRASWPSAATGQGAAQAGGQGFAARRAGPRFRYRSVDLAPRGKVIEQVTGVHYHPGHVWKILAAMEWSLQPPAKRARERNEEGRRLWMAKRWP